MDREQNIFRIIRGVGGNYWAHKPNLEEVQVQAPGVFRKKNNKPLAGDLTVCEATGDGLIPYRMTEILARKNSIPRPPIVNIDTLWLIIPLANPEPDLWVLDKMLVIAHTMDVPVKIIFTKEDIAEDHMQTLADIYRSIPYEVVLSNPEKSDLILSLRDEIQGKFIALAGPSGAGKSTLLNLIFDADMMPTQEISEKLGRGKHTTRHVELFPLANGYLADTPGFSSLDLAQAGVSEEQLVQAYPEIWEKQNACRYLSCKHLSEPECAIKSDPSINPGRLERYQEFRKQLEVIQDYERRPYR